MNLPAKQGDYTVDPEFISEMQECYSRIDVPGQLVLMKAWLIANESKRKTHRGMKRFIQHWLSKAKPEAQTDDRGFIEKHTDRNWREGL